MAKWLLIILVAVQPALGFDLTHRNWSTVLKRYVNTEGRVNYAKLRADIKENKKHPYLLYLKEIKTLRKAAFFGWPKEDEMAYLINAYNALTVEWILKKYPVESIKSTVGFLRNPWKQDDWFTVLEGTITSLHEIEHDFLIDKYKDARIHAAINCASISCPNLRSTAYVGKKLNEQLDAAMKEWLADESKNRFDTEKGVLYLSKVFDWYDDEFEKQFGSIQKVVRKYGPMKRAVAAIEKKGEIEYLDYNWNLNDVR